MLFIWFVNPIKDNTVSNQMSRGLASLEVFPVLCISVNGINREPSTVSSVKTGFVLKGASQYLRNEGKNHSLCSAYVVVPSCGHKVVLLYHEM